MRCQAERRVIRDHSRAVNSQAPQKMDSWWFRKDDMTGRPCWQRVSRERTPKVNPSANAPLPATLQDQHPSTGLKQDRARMRGYLRLLLDLTSEGDNPLPLGHVRGTTARASIQTYQGSLVPVMRLRRVEGKRTW